ncbi:MAG: UBP-type zinc finger domain-containing protein [Dehalococcoidia bacterium]
MARLSWKERFLQLLWTGRAKSQVCTHLHLITDVSPSSTVCEECITLGDVWVGLRMCAICGKVGCCENSKNHHAGAHFEGTGHPIVYSDPVDSKWCWCYVDKTLVR